MFLLKNLRSSYQKELIKETKWISKFSINAMS